jgi:uncharacterized protein (TIGR04206 family)
MAGDDPNQPDDPDRARKVRRVAVLVAVALVPWTFVSAPGVRTYLFSFGLFNFAPAQLTTITDYYFTFTAGLPQYLLAWGVGTLVYGLALISALSGLVWREDVRLTAALLVVAGFAELWVSWGFVRRPGYLAVPVGTVLMWTVVWWYYRSDLRGIFVGTPDLD